MDSIIRVRGKRGNKKLRRNHLSDARITSRDHNARIEATNVDHHARLELLPLEILEEIYLQSQSTSLLRTSKRLRSLLSNDRTLEKMSVSVFEDIGLFPPYDAEENSLDMAKLNLYIRRLTSVLSLPNFKFEWFARRARSWIYENLKGYATEFWELEGTDLDADERDRQLKKLEKIAYQGLALKPRTNSGSYIAALITKFAIFTDRRVIPVVQRVLETSDSVPHMVISSLCQWSGTHGMSYIMSRKVKNRHRRQRKWNMGGFKLHDGHPAYHTSWNDIHVSTILRLLVLKTFYRAPFSREKARMLMFFLDFFQKSTIDTLHLYRKGGSDLANLLSSGLEDALREGSLPAIYSLAPQCFARLRWGPYTEFTTAIKELGQSIMNCDPPKIEIPKQNVETSNIWALAPPCLVVEGSTTEPLEPMTDEKHLWACIRNFDHAPRIYVLLLWGLLVHMKDINEPDEPEISREFMDAFKECKNRYASEMQPEFYALESLLAKWSNWKS